jgi:hypothetical protein
MNSKLRYWCFDYAERTREYKFRFKNGYITVNAKSEKDAKILAQAEAIKRDWDYEILPNTMSMEELKELIGDKVDEIVNVYTERINASKDIDPFDEATLSMIKDTLAAFIVKAYK